MALKIWLPLDGSLRNIGTDSVTYSRTTNASTFATDGILGGQALTAYGTSIQFSTSIPTASGVTIAFWVKPTSSNSWSDMFSLNSFNDRLERTSTTSQYAYYRTSGNVGLIPSGTIVSSSIADGTWYHIVLSCNGSTTRFYVNGALTGTYSVVGNYTIDTVTIASRYAADCMINGEMSDFRIYDEALELKDITELYTRRMILHYPLSSQSFAYNTVNLLTNSPENPLSWVQESCTRTDAGSHVIKIVIPANTAVRIYNTTTNVWYSGRTYHVRYKARAESDSIPVTVTMSRSLSDFTSAATLTGEWAEYEGVISCTTTATGGTLSFQMKSSSATNVYLKDVILTSSVHGYMENCAGYSAQLSINGTASFNDESSYISSLTTGSSATVPSFTAPITTGNTFKYFTVMGWFYITTSTASSDLFSIGGSSFVRLQYYKTSTITSIRYYVNVAGTACTNYYDTYLKNGWNHVALVFHNGWADIYLNGSIGHSYSHTGTGNTLTCGNNEAYICASSLTSDYLEGKARDIRVYASRLAEDDNTTQYVIKNIYQSSMEISRSGYAYSLAFAEYSSSKVQMGKRIVLSNSITERKIKYDHKVYSESDSSMWIRIARNNNPSSYRFLSSDAFTSGVYKNNGQSWFAVHACNYVTSWELMVKQATTASGTETKYRWIQYANPMTCAFGDVDAADVTNVSGYSTVANYGGLYLKNSNTYLSVNNGTASKWFGAIGSWTAWNNGIPGWGSTAVTTGYLDLYLRIDNVDISSLMDNIGSTASACAAYRDGYLQSVQIIEK